MISMMFPLYGLIVHLSLPASSFIILPSFSSVEQKSVLTYGCMNNEGRSMPCANPQDTCLHRAEDYYQENPTNWGVGGVAYPYTVDNLATPVGSVRYPGILSNYDYRTKTPEDFLAETEEILMVMKQVYDDVGAVPREGVSYNNVIKPLVDLDGDVKTRSETITLAKHVALDKELRDASSEADKKITDLWIDLRLRQDVFENVKAFSETEEAKSLNYEQKRYLEQFLRDGKRNGLLLSGEELEEFKNKEKKISQLGIDFRKCLSEDTSHFYAEEKDLEGVAQDVIDSMEKDESGRRKVTTQKPHYFPVIKTCKNSNTRFIMEKTYQSICVKENTPRIEELMYLRQRKAELLGYPTHAAFVQEIMMAKNPEAVDKFLTDLSSKLKVLWKAEKQTMLDFKEMETKELGLEFNGKIEKEDFWYYGNEVIKKNYSVDEEKLKEYFPLDTVTNGMLEIYQRLLGLKFTKLEHGEVWHDEVTQYQVDDVATGETIGYFYMDLHPREGKFGHAAMFPMQPGSLDRFGNRQKAVAMMVCNFPKASGEKPALLEHGQVEKYFHEFGHVMHEICSRTNISKFYGASTEVDFGEAPSQMLENWVWEEESLKLMSGHYKDGSPIPSDLLTKLVASKSANEGGKSLRQIFLSTLDLTLHTRGEADTVQLAKEIYKDLLGIDRIEGTNIAANIVHLIKYDAGLYGYMWSKVFSQDMFDTRFGAEGILNPKTGMDYRNSILRPGGSLDGAEMLKNFLGREPNQEAFLKSKGLEL